MLLHTYTLHMFPLQKNLEIHHKIVILMFYLFSDIQNNFKSRLVVFYVLSVWRQFTRYKRVYIFDKIKLITVW